MDSGPAGIRAPRGEEKKFNEMKSSIHNKGVTRQQVFYELVPPLLSFVGKSDQDETNVSRTMI